MTDSVQLRGIQVPSPLGVTEAERALRRPVEIDLDLLGDLRPSAASDDLEDTIDYVEIFQTVSRVAGAEHRLVEALAQDVCQALLRAFPRMEEVRIEVRKIAPLAGAVRSAGVRLVRRRE